MNPNTDKSDRSEQGGRAGDSPREQAARADDGADRTKVTPATDMQPEDVGTDASGDVDSAATGTPAESVMKQQSKTDAERG